MEKMKNAKRNIFRDKKGVNDISILAILVFVLFGSAIIIPFVNAAFDTGASAFDTDGLAGDVQQDAENVGRFNAFEVLFTLFKLAFFDFGDTLGLPFWLDAVYTVLAILLIVLLARNIWIGGGG